MCPEIELLTMSVLSQQSLPSIDLHEMCVDHLLLHFFSLPLFNPTFQILFNTLGARFPDSPPNTFQGVALNLDPDQFRHQAHLARQV